jgi:hypothetical protein
MDTNTRVLQGISSTVPSERTEFRAPQFELAVDAYDRTIRFAANGKEKRQF